MGGYLPGTHPEMHSWLQKVESQGPGRTLEREGRCSQVQEGSSEVVAEGIIQGVKQNSTFVTAFFCHSFRVSWPLGEGIQSPCCQALHILLSRDENWH